MPEPTLIQVFGSGATQSATTLSINKADLTAVGLTAIIDNSAESLLVAIMLLAKNHLTTTNFGTNLDQSTTIEEGFETLTTRGTSSVRQKQLNFNLYKVEPTVTIDPDDY